MNWNDLQLVSFFIYILLICELSVLWVRRRSNIVCITGVKTRRHRTRSQKCQRQRPVTKYHSVKCRSMNVTERLVHHSNYHFNFCFGNNRRVIIPIMRARKTNNKNIKIICTSSHSGNVPRFAFYSVSYIYTHSN